MPTDHPAEFLRALLDASLFAIIALDKAGRVRLWSRGAEQILGSIEAERNGLPLPAEMEPLIRSSHVVDVRLVRNDGVAIEIEAWTSAWQEGTVTIVADERRHRTNQRLRELLEAAPDSIIEVDREGRILTLNAATERLSGYSRNELLGQPVETLVPEQVRSKHAAYRAGYTAHPVRRPMGIDLALHGQRKNGSTFPVEISLSPVNPEEGFRVTAIIRDVTERGEAPDRLQAIQTEYARELELRNREIEQTNRHKSVPRQYEPRAANPSAHRDRIFRAAGGGIERASQRRPEALREPYSQGLSAPARTD